MSASGDSSDKSWLENRTGLWQRVEDALPRLEDRKPVAAEELRDAVLFYPEIARDLAIARRAAPQSRVTSYLESVYLRLYRALFRPPRNAGDDLLHYLTRDIPEITRGLRWQIASVTAGFIIAAVLGWLLVWHNPEMASLFASEAMITTVQSGKLWTDGLLNVTPASVLSVGILTNNIVVALTTMALGSLYGLGTIYIIGVNGLMLGSIFAFTAHYGMAGRLFEFVLAHGVVELSVIFVAGAIGFSIGESLARPGLQSRGQAFRNASQRGVRLMVVCSIFLVGAGFIEGYVSPNPDFGMTARGSIGFGYWLLFLLALSGWRLPFASRPAAGS